MKKFVIATLMISTGALVGLWGGYLFCECLGDGVSME